MRPHIIFYFLNCLNKNFFLYLYPSNEEHALKKNDPQSFSMQFHVWLSVFIIYLWNKGIGFYSKYAVNILHNIVTIISTYFFPVNTLWRSTTFIFLHYVYTHGSKMTQHFTASIIVFWYHMLNVTTHNSYILTHNMLVIFLVWAMHTLFVNWIGNELSWYIWRGTWRVFLKSKCSAWGNEKIWIKKHIHHPVTRRHAKRPMKEEVCSLPSFQRQKSQKLVFPVD